jgi:Flp pilus assembly protein TadB
VALPVLHGETFRCRLGLHHWTRLRIEDRDLDNPRASAEWVSVCRDCGAGRADSIGLALAICAAAVVASVLVFWLVSPLLGAIIMIGAVGGLMWTMLPASISLVARWLSVGR